MHRNQRSAITGDVQPQPRSRARSQPRKPKPRRPVNRAHKKVEERIREAERKFRTIFDNTSDGIFLHDLETLRLTMCNRSCLQMLGYTEKEFLNLNVWDLHLPADLPFIYTQIEEFVKGREPIRHDIRFRRKDGSILFVDLNADLVLFDGKRYVLIAMKDITERKRAEEALAESEHKYRSLVENIPDVTWTTDRQGRTLFISPNVADVYGYSAEEVYAGGDAWLANVHPDDRVRIERAFDKLFTKKTRYDVEYRIRRKDGNWIWLHDRSVSSYEKDGRWYADGVFSEITQRKRMEEELRRHAEHLEELVAVRTGELQESEARYRSLYHTIADGIFVMGMEGRIDDVNDSACAELGYTREELLGTPGSAVFARPDLDLGEILDRLRTSGSFSYETTHRRKDGTLVPVELSVTQFEHRGRPAVLGVARDITERKRAEEALRASEEKFRAMADQAPIMIGVTNEKGDITFLNQAWLDFRGRTLAQEAGWNWAEDVHPGDRDRVVAAMRSAIERGDRYSVEYRIRDSRADYRWVLDTATPLLGPDGEPRGYIGTALDITERKWAEEALRQLSRRNEEALRVARMGHWEFDVATGMFTFNDQYYTLHGITAREAGGYRMSAEEFARRYVYPDDAYLVQEHIRRAIEARDPDFQVQAEARILCAEGKARWVTVWFRIEKDAQGRTITLHGVNQDITERRQAEEALRESEERFRSAFEEGAVGMALAAMDTTLLKVNSSFCRMLGFSESELTGRSFTEITHPDDIAGSLVGTRRLARGEISSFRMEKRYIRKDGIVVWGDMHAVAVRDANGRPLYCVTHIQDITDRKQAEEALRSLNERLELQVAQRTEDLRHTVDRLRQLTLELSQAEDRERQRIADILHEDVQQTLAAARFHLNLLGSGLCSDEESEKIVEQVRQMLKEAIEKSRSLSHELSPALYQVELTAILEWLARHMEQGYGVTVRVEAHGPVDSSSEPLKAFLYRVAQELLFNVVKHAGVREARIRVRRKGQCIYLSVVDRGRGFDPQKLEATSGFGLLGIQERVQLLGGRMKIRSVPDRGSRFLIEVPDQEVSQASSP